jgi:hypothetical protein
MSDVVPQSGDLDPWGRVLGPLYSRSAIERLGYSHRSDLVTITTSDGEILYPQGQFDAQKDGSVIPREEVINAWNTYIDLGVIDEYTAGAYFFQRYEGGPSRADTLASDKTPQIAKIHMLEDLSRMMSRMSQ